jgi:hypothetical protein
MSHCNIHKWRHFPTQRLKNSKPEDSICRAEIIRTPFVRAHYEPKHYLVKMENSGENFVVPSPKLSYGQRSVGKSLLV